MSHALYRDQVPRLLRWLGCFMIDDGALRFWWGEINFSFGLALGYSVYHESASWRIHLLWPAMYLKAPMLIRQRQGTEDWMASYGFSLFDRSIHLNWRTRCKIINFPWSYTWVRSSYLLNDGSWHVERGRMRLGDGTSMREIMAKRGWRETHPYVYMLRSGEAQERLATISVNEMEWRQRWLKWCPWFAKVVRSIEIEFNDEVGERTGSWKGGCLGCGYALLPDELPVHALRRMERERKF